MESGMRLKPMKRRPVVPKLKIELGMALAQSLIFSQGFSLCQRTDVPICILLAKSMALKPTLSITGAIGSIMPVLIPVASHRL
jgi:hypothetical protein